MLHNRNTAVFRVLSAVFSQKINVAIKRIAILKVLNKHEEDGMKFRDILKDVRSEVGDIDYNSQKLTYDLRVLRKNGLVAQTWEGNYTITRYGHYLLLIYNEIANIFDEQREGKMGFMGEAKGQIKVDGFDPALLAEELTRLPIFRKKILASKRGLSIELNDETLKSDIEIQKSGHFSIKVLLYPSGFVDPEDFMTEFEVSEEWFEISKSITQTIFYYIKRAAKKLWPNSQLEVTVLDAYPI